MLVNSSSNFMVQKCHIILVVMFDDIVCKNKMHFCEKILKLDYGYEISYLLFMLSKNSFICFRRENSYVKKMHFCDNFTLA